MLIQRVGRSALSARLNSTFSSMRRFKRLLAALALLGAVLVAAGVPSRAQTPPSPTVPGAPSMRILRGEPLSPTTAGAYYGGVLTSTDGLCRDYGANAQICPGGVRPPAPEIIELARALRHDPDLIYEYVRNSIETEFVFGLHEGSLGTLIDGAGGAFDQAELMVELFRASGFSARYRFGEINLNATQFHEWTGFTQARAACEYLAAGGIPAVVNGAASCEVSGNVASVTMSHVWVEAVISGGIYLFDPALKPHEHVQGIDVRAAMGLQQGAALAAAMQGYTQSADGRTVSQFNQPALASLLQGYANSLAQRFRQTDMLGADMTNVVGGEIIIPAVRPQNGWRQISLAHVSPSSTLWQNIPDQFRTTLRVRRRNEDNSVVTYANVFLDEIAGRRLEIDHERSPASPITGTGNPQILLDHVPIFTGAPYPGPVYNRDYHITIVIEINHPFAAANGAYGDDAFERRIMAANPVSVVYGQGRVSSALGQRWGLEQSQNREGIEYGSVTTNPETGEVVYIYSTGDRTRALLSAAWLSQFTTAADLHARLAGARVSQLHTIGVVYAQHDMGFSSTPGSPGPWFSRGPVETLDLQTATALTSLTSDQTARRAGLHALAATAAALEGSVFEQLSNNPDSASTARRFAWGDEPEAVDTHMPNAARAFRGFASTDATPAAADLVFDGSLNGPYVSGYVNPPGYRLEEVAFFKGNLIDTISAYQQQGFSIVTGMDAALGPGNLHDGHGVPLNTRERGGAFVATRYDQNGDPIEIAHVITTPFEQSKGGGGFSVLEPPETASVLRSRFSDRSSQLGVNLGNGSVGYTSEIVSSVGHGEYPYRLDERLVLASGPSAHADHIENGTASGVPRSFRGWHPAGGDLVSSFFGSATLSNSGDEAMGRSRIEAATGTLVAFAAMQDIWRAVASPQREVSGLLTANWWANLLVGNVVSIRSGASAQQYARSAAGDYLAANSDGSRIIGNFTVVRGALCDTPPCPRAVNPYPDPPASPTITTPSAYQRSPRFWMMAPTSGPRFVRTDGNGNVNEYDIAAPSAFETPSATFGITRSVFASGIVLTYAWSTDINRRLLSVSSNLGYTLALSNAPWNYVFDPENQSTYQSACLSWTNNVTNPTSSIARTFTDASTGQYRLRFRAPQARTPTRRPLDSCQLEAIFLPSDQSIASTEYIYNSVQRVSEVRDAIAIREPSARGPHLFFIADRYRGERQDPLGGRYAVETLEGGRIKRHIDELGRVTMLEFDGRGRTTRAIFPEGDAIEQSFDLRGNVLQVTRIPKPGSGQDPIVTSALYGEAANVLACANPRTCNRPLSHTDGRGFVRNFSWDAASGMLTQALDPADSSGLRPQTDYAYTLFGPGGSQFRLLTSITQKIDAATNLVTTQSYNAANHFTPQTRTVDTGGLNLITTFTYDPSGNLVAEDGPRTDVSDVHYFTFDNARRPVFDISADPDGAGGLPRVATRTSYNVDGAISSTARGTTTSTIGTDFTAVETTNYGYDAAGNPVRTTSPAGVIQDSFDAMNRTRCSATRMNPSVYASLPADACVLSPQGTAGPDRITRFSYDLAGQATSEERGVGTSDAITYSTHGYTPNGMRDWVQDANGNRSDYTYDGFDRLQRLAFPTGAVGSGLVSTTDFEEYSHDENDNRRTLRLRSGETIVFDYDALNREVTKDITGSSESDVHSRYDLLGRRRYARFGVAGAPSVDCASSSNGIDFCYDRAGRLTRKTSFGRIMEFRYDDRVNRTRMTWPDGNYVEYTSDAMNRMDQVRENGVTSGPGLLADYNYDALDRRAVIARGNGAVTTFSYDGASRLSTLDHELSGTTADATFAFTHNPASQVASRILDNDAYRFPLSARGEAYTPSALNTISPTAGPAYAYDARGNLVGDGARTFCYDLENRLTGVATAAGNACAVPTFALAYDPIGRLRQTVGATTTQFLYDEDRLSVEYGGSGAILRRYVHGADVDEPLVWYEGGLLSDRRWLHTNNQGSVIAASNGAAALIGQPYSYGAWGEPDAANGWAGSRFRYTGQIMLPEAGLYHYKARVYDPGLGRFLQTDPIGYVDDLNLYQYTRNDPLNNSDPSGRDIVCDAMGLNCRETIDLVVTARRPQLTQDQFSAYTNSISGPMFGQFVDVWTSALLVNGIYHCATDETCNPTDLIPFARTGRALRGIRRRGDCCFVAGTLVHTEEGLRPIEQLQVGDRVLSRDETTGETAFKPVVALVPGHPRQLWRVTIAASQGTVVSREESFGTTADHPWRTDDGRWLRTDELVHGTVVARAAGEPALVVSVVNTGANAITYNIEVEDFHTYFVGEGGVWVHNSCNQMNQQIRRGQAPDGITRVDRGKVTGEQDHVHVNGGALNRDGTWKHTPGRQLTNAQREWLTGHGWGLPPG